MHKVKAKKSKYIMIILILSILFFILFNIQNEESKKQEITIEKVNSKIYENKTNNNIEKQSTKDAKTVEKEIIETEFKGYKVSSKIYIPKINLETYVLEQYSKQALLTSVTKFYGANPNQIGNFCVAGHNYGPSNMFQNLRKLNINDEIYFEFFAKPYDYHINPRDNKGIIFDTCRSFDEKAVWDMFKNEKISAYNSSSNFIKSFNKGDYVFYYHKGWGVIGVGIVKSSRYKEVFSDNELELYHKVELLTPKLNNENEIKCISANEICNLLGKKFYWASTTKRPYLSSGESKILADELIIRYNKK